MTQSHTFGSTPMAQTQDYSRRGEFIAGMKATIPLIVGAIPFGIVFGAVAVTGDRPLSPEAAMGMSLFVFAGSAQFIGAGLFAGGVGTALIVFTTFIVNLRHALYSASLAPYMKHLSQKWLLPLGFWLTDETYAVTIGRYTNRDRSPYKHWYHLGSAVLMYTNWQICTLIGVVAGQAVPDDAAEWGLEFAMVVTFIGIIVPLIRTRPMVVAAVVAGLSALLFNGLENQMGLMVASVLGIIAGYVAEQTLPASSQPVETAEEASHE